jgi:metallophosphoesterase (TIGR00282 family)
VTGADPFRVLFVGDVVGRPGRAAVKALLPRLKRELEPNLVVVNGENAAGGFGITMATAAELFHAGANVLTTGNHVWDQKEFQVDIQREEYVLRPANYPRGVPGRGVLELCVDGESVLVIDLQGRTFMPPLDDPFRVVDEILAEHREPRIVIVDMHAEATAEKIAMGWHLDGRASLVVGTHTHVPTADARVLEQGTAYVTDVGMVGPRDGVIGIKRQSSLARFITGLPQRNEVAPGVVTFNSVLVTISRPTGRAQTMQRVDRELA